MKIVINKKKLSQIQEKRIIDKKYTILLVDDEPANLNSLTMVLEDKYHIFTANTGIEALEIIKKVPNPEKFDLIISDQRMPEMSGVEFLKQTISIIPKTVRIILTGYTDINDTIDSINEGHVYKFLTKPIEPNNLIVSLQRALEAYELERQNVRLINQLQEMNENLEHLVEERTKLLEESYSSLKKQKEELEYLSNFQDSLVSELELLSITDPLTGLANRRWLESYIKEECDNAGRNQKEVSILMLDVDHFKLYNDFYGHAMGDKCIKKVAEILKKTIAGKKGLAARYGGEEFCCVLTDSNFEGAIVFAKEILNEIRREAIPHEKSSTAAYVTVSIGAYSVLPKDGESSMELIRTADNYLYNAKKNGRNQISTN